jgi:hypothetical protein
MCDSVHFSVFLKFFYVDIILYFLIKIKEKNQVVVFFLLKIRCHFSIKRLQKNTRMSFNISLRIIIFYTTTELDTNLR